MTATVIVNRDVSELCQTSKVEPFAKILKS